MHTVHDHVENVSGRGHCGCVIETDAAASRQLEEELAWLRDVVPTWQWKWASTFEGGAEHAYVIKGRHLDAATYERAARLIHGAGMPRKFYRRLNIELHLPDLDVPYGREPIGRRPLQHGVKLWLMSHRTSVSKALNIAPMTAEYGRQDAPSTTPTAVSSWDLEALDFDDAFERSDLGRLGDALSRMVWRGGEPTHVTDLGARAGAALDLGIAERSAGYTAIEPSRGLLHSLLFKHQWVRDVHTVDVDTFLSGEGDRQYEAVVALFGAGSNIHPESIRELTERSQRLLLMHHAGRPERDFFSGTHLPEWSDASRAAAATLPGASSTMLGDYLVTVV